MSDPMSASVSALDSDPKTLASIREKAAAILSDIDSKSAEGEAPSSSWVRGVGADDDRQQDVTARCQFFDRNGFIHIPGFAGESEINGMKQQMEDLANKEWDPAAKTSVFRTDHGQTKAQGSDDYFLSSASRVHFFAEKDATNDDGSLKPEFANNKMAALNKAGHAMHIIPGAFRDYTTSKKVKDLVRELGWKDPIIPQSMYIFKQAKVGGEVTSHQDSTFLFTEPRQTCLGLWLALDESTLENGCLWVRPGSHKEPVRRKFIRNPAHFGVEAIQSRRNEALGDTSQPQMVFEQLVEDADTVPWEGKLPEGSFPRCEGLFGNGFLPVQCKSGDLLAFCGELDHLSLPNCSEKQRHTFQLHLVDGPGAGILWSKSNWLQYPEDEEFLRI